MVYGVCDNFYSDSWLLKHKGKWRMDDDDRPQKEYIVEMKMDFKPKSGDYHLNWPGPPRRKWKYSDRKEYIPTFTISHGRPPMGTLKILIKEDKTGTDPILAVGKYNGDKFWMDNSSLSRDHEAPVRTNDVFWLVCTKKRRVKGDYGKGDDEHAKVYMEVQPASFGGDFCSLWSGGPKWAVHFYKTQSPRHTIRCK